MKNTKKSLVLSVVALLVCVSMLVGTTFAWFTDSITSGTNQVTAGNLDIELEYSKDGQSWSTVQDATDLFTDVDGGAMLWEPGATSVVYLRLTNKGSLALKYNLAVESTGGDFTNAAGAAVNLKDALTFAQVAGSSLVTYETREQAVAATASVAQGLNSYAAANHMAAGDISYISLVVTMPTTVDNTYNCKTGTDAPVIDLTVSLTATQYSSEKDSIDAYYDLMTDTVDVYTVEEFNKAVEKAADGTVINIRTAGLDLNVAYDDAKVITLKGEKIGTLTVNIPNGTIHLYNEADTVVGENVDASHSAHLYNKVTNLNASAGHFVVEAGAVVENVVAAPATVADDPEAQSNAKELVIEVKGVVNKVTTPAAEPVATVDITVAGTVGEVEVPKADTKIALKVEQSATVNEVNIIDTAADAAIVLQNDGTVGNAAEVAAKVQTFAEIDKTGKTVTIKDADELRAFAKGVNAGELNGYTATLSANIDLNNVEWNQIDAAGKSIVFNGNGKTISNLKISDGHDAGLFKTGSGLTVKNLTVDGATVKGVGRIAVLVGHGMCATVENCTVKNATVTAVVTNNDDGDKAGAIVGYLSGEPNASVTGCTVENVTVTGYRDIGALVGYAGGTATISGNIVTDCVVVNDRANNYKNYTADADYDVNEICGEKTADVTFADNTATGVQRTVMLCKGLTLDGTTYTVSQPEGFAKLFESGVLSKTATVEITADLDMTGITMPYYNDWNDYSITFNGNDHTISNITKVGTNHCGLFDRGVALTVAANDLTFKNCSFTVTNKDGDESGAGVFVGACDVGFDGTFTDITLDSCVIGPTKYAGGLAGIVWASDADNFTLTNVTFKDNTLGGYSAGLVVGHTCISVNATGIQATDNTVNSYLPAGKSGSGYAGVYVGTVNAGTFTLTATQHSGNTPAALYGRTAGGTVDITEQ